MTSLVFPDVNLWLALASRRHTHHTLARNWLDTVENADLAFCRFTQLGLLRLLTTAAVMGPDILNQRQAWHAYDRLTAEQVRFLEEPPSLEERFRQLTHQTTSSPKEWADAYLAAFALEAGATLATFDKALAARSGGVLIR
jgi:toxin-antitoxin system PIN domain toxin